VGKNGSIVTEIFISRPYSKRDEGEREVPERYRSLYEELMECYDKLYAHSIKE